MSTRIGGCRRVARCNVVAAGNATLYSDQFPVLVSCLWND